MGVLPHLKSLIKLAQDQVEPLVFIATIDASSDSDAAPSEADEQPPLQRRRLADPTTPAEPDTAVELEGVDEYPVPPLVGFGGDDCIPNHRWRNNGPYVPESQRWE